MLSNVINYLDEHEPTQFIAPILTRDTTEVLTIQNGIPYWFNVQVETPDWYSLTPPQGKGAVTTLDCAPYERIQYLEQLDRFYVITLFPLDDTTWMVSPYNLGDADQRGWLAGEPRAMYLVEGTLQPLEVVKARVLGKSLVYGSPAYSLSWQTFMTDPAKKHATAIFTQRIADLEAEERKREIETRKQSHKGRLEEALQHTGATLLDWTRNLDGYEVTWEYQGQQRTITIDTNLRVLSAGVCLDGTSGWHSLSSIVEVMNESYETRGY